MRFERLGWICVLLLGTADVASARELFISNVRGDDAADGSRPESTVNGGPVRSIGRALHIARPGDYLVVENTGIPYRESLSLSAANHSGTAVRPFTILGNGATIDGTQPIAYKSWESVRGQLYRFRPTSGGRLELFTADGKPAPQVPVDTASGKLPALTGGQWCGHDGYIYLRLADGKIPYDFRDAPYHYAALPVGITLYHVHDVRIVDLTIQGFRRDGVNVADGVRNVSLGGLILRGNGRCGLAVGGSSLVEADGCLAGNNGTSQVILDGYSTLSLQRCELLANPAPKLTRQGDRARLYFDGRLIPFGTALPAAAPQPSESAPPAAGGMN
jgi:hypothetical protein